MLVIGLPMTVVWVIGAPLFVLIVMIKNRHNLHKAYMQKYLLLLYQGLEPRVFYWEFVNAFRKLLIPIVNVLVYEDEEIYKILTALIILLALFRVQLYLKPYKLEENNKAEMLAILAGILTLFSGIPMAESINENRRVEFVQVIALVVI